MNEATEQGGLAMIVLHRAFIYRSSSDQAGDASGLPFSTTYVLMTTVLVLPFLAPACGVATGTWKPSPDMRRGERNECSINAVHLGSSLIGAHGL